MKNYKEIITQQVYEKMVEQKQRIDKDLQEQREQKIQEELLQMKI